MKLKPSTLLLIFGILLCSCTSVTPNRVKSVETPSVIPQQYQDYCTVVSNLLSSPNPTDEAFNAQVPAVNENDWVEGPISAEVTFLEYADFQ